MSPTWQEATDQVTTADRASHRLRATLFLGAVLAVGVWAAAALFYGQRVAALQEQSDEVSARYVKAQQLVTEARTQVLLSTLHLREMLVEPDDRLAADGQRRATEALEQADAQLAAYRPIMSTSDEPQRLVQLRADLASLRAELAEVLVDDARRFPERTEALLRSRLGPRRESVLQLAEEMARLNRSAYVAYQIETVGFSRRIQGQLVRTLGLALVVSLGIGVLAWRRASQLEEEVRHRAHQDQRLRADLRRLSASLIQVREGERRSIARELHDEIGQMLLAAKVELARAEQSEPVRARARIAGVREIVDQAIHATRDLSRLLHPAILDDLGLAEAIAEQVRATRERHAIGVLFNHSGLDQTLPSDVGVAAYRIIQEALTNVVRHAAASTCRVDAAVADGRLQLVVEDNGRGFSSTSETRGLGLVGIRERALQLGGSCEIESQPGRGTRVHVTLPIAPDRSDAVTGAVFRNEVLP